MSATLTLKTNAAPTYFNKEAAIGTLAGFIGGGLLNIPLTMMTGIPGLGSAIAILGGAAVGGSVGKSRMEHELAHGKEVGEPTRWNKDAAIGGMLGWLGGAVAALGVLLVGGLGSVITSGATAMPEVAGVGLLATAVGALASPFIGAAVGTYIGGGMGKSQMEKDFQQAQIEQAVSQKIEQGKMLSLAQEVEQQQGKGHTVRIEQERALAAVVQNQR